MRQERSAVRRLAAARAISDTGSWAATIALSLVIYSQTHSTLWLSASFFFTAGLGALIAPVAGVIADRFDRQRVMILCDLLGACAYVAMALVHRPVGLIALGSVAVILHAPFGPSASAATPNLVSGDDLAWANGTLNAAGNIGNVLGPVIGGVLVTAVHAQAVFLLNAISFVGSAALITTVRGRFQQTEAREETTSGQPHGWLAGLRYLVDQPVLLILTTVGAVTFIASEVSWVADLPLIQLFHVGGRGYGVMMATWGAGLLLGSFLAARLVKRATEPMAAVVGTLTFGAFLACVGLVRWFPAVPLALFLVGLSDSFAIVGFMGIYQRRAPDEIRGRMFAAVGGIMTLATALGFSVAGFIVAATGPRPVYVVGGIIDVAAALALGIALRSSLPRAEPGAVPVS